MIPSGAIKEALLAAAARGAKVVVRLDGSPYRDTDGRLKALNDRVIALLRKAGADASEVDGSSHAQPMHLKGVVIDGNKLYLDDRNFARASTVLLDTAHRDVTAVEAVIEGTKISPRPGLALQKVAALQLETHLIDHARRGESLYVATEAIGVSSVTRALENAALRGVCVHLAVSEMEVKSNVYDRRAIAQLAADGVHVRASSVSEKYAVLGARAWIGSANATPGRNEQTDWGLQTSATDVVAHLKRLVKCEER